MTKDELIAQYRRAADDNEDPYLVSDNELVDLFNIAIDEACERKRLIFDDSTSDVCEVAVVSGTRTYTAHSSIVCITSAYLLDSDDNYLYLSVKDRDELDWADPHWREYSDEPRALVFDETNITFDREPTSDYTLHIEVYRRQLDSEKLTRGGVTPEVLTPVIHGAHHKQLYHYPLSVVLVENDPDGSSPQKGAYHGKVFDQYFGLPLSANRLKRARSNTPPRNKVW